MSTQTARPPREMQPLDRDRTRIASALMRLAKRLKRPNDGCIDEALAAVADARAELERVERELVALARADGRSWAQIGADLNIIVPRQPEPPVPAIRYARPRRPRTGASGNGNGDGDRAA